MKENQKKKKIQENELSKDIFKLMFVKYNSLRN